MADWHMFVYVYVLYVEEKCSLVKRGVKYDMTFDKVKAKS